MRYLLFLSFLTCIHLSEVRSQSTIDSTGLPGDHFSLEAALDIFKKSSNPEEFEKKLNQENNKINNLDLNDDGDVDYVRVEDHHEGDVHAIVLRVPVSDNEHQDIAVIEIEKITADSAVLQIIGDEDIYGETTIVEPVVIENGSGKGGPSISDETLGLVVNVWFGYPCVRYVYRPSYVAYVSPWRWHHYPRWWRPWRPVRWGLYVSWWRPLRVHYHVVQTHRVVRAHRIYTPVRRTSVTVVQRNQPVLNQFRANRKPGVTTKSTTTTTLVKGKRGTAVSREQTSKVAKTGRDGTTRKTEVTRKTGAVKTDKGVVAGRKTTKKGSVKNGKVKKTKQQSTTTKVGRSKGGKKAGAKRTTKRSRSVRRKN